MTSTNLYYIPPGQPFLPVLARGMLARFGEDPLQLARVEILLPNRRSCRAFAEALLKESGKASLLLPAISAIGDAPDDDEPALPPPLTTPRRLLIQSEKIASGLRDLPYVTAFAWAEKLCSLQDECTRYGVPLSALPALLPEEMAAHREILLSLLHMIADETASTQQTAEMRRNHLLRAKTAQLREAQHPVIAAGSLGTIPATADLLRAIAQSPQGMVILPGLDKECAQDVPPTHPQYGLQRLLKHFSARADEIKEWPNVISSDSEKSRFLTSFEMTKFMNNWFQPDFQPQPVAAPAHLMLLEADTDFEEAESIAAALRETLETPGKTAMLVTPDRKLARQVSACLKQWEVTVDDSAGMKLSHTPMGSLLLLLLDAAAAPQSPLALLPLLKHPLCRFSRQEARELELQYFRRHRKPRGDFYTSVQAALVTLAELLTKPRLALLQLLAAHREIFAAFCMEDAKNRPETAQYEKAFEELSAAAENRFISSSDYPLLFRQLFARYTYRPAFGTHPRLSILSPMEARLMHADRVIISSLNETFWPGKASEDWLGKKLRTQLGLPQHPEAIGHAAHDFCQLAAAPEVLLTRARYSDGTPQNPHPWLIRLQSLCTPHVAPHLNWLRAQKISVAMPLQPPAPNPPFSARPLSLSATDIRDLMQQPYRYYARKILQLSPLDPLRNETMEKEIGSALHRALEAYVISAPWPQPHSTLCRLLQDFIRPVLGHPAEWVLWQARIPLIAEKFLQWDEAERKQYPHVHVEQTGSASLIIGKTEIDIHAKADRIALNDQGEARISDYKTGTIPENKEIREGWQPQLMVEQWILESAGYNTVLSTASAPRCTDLFYWKLQSSDTRAELKNIPPMETKSLEVQLSALLALFYDRNLPFFAIPLDYRKNTDPYAHLIRMEEAFFH